MATFNGTTTGGTLIDSFTIPPNGRGETNLLELDVSLPPTLKLIITARSTSAATGNVTATLTWYEDL